jgi:hypothetical protein
VRRRRAVTLAAAALAALPVASGCVTLAMLRPLPCACPGPLLAVDEMGADFALRARYRVRSGEREEALLLAAEKRGPRLVLLGLDPLGTQVFSLVQEANGEPRRERHLRPLFPFAPENALRDLERVRFPELLAPRDGETRVEAADDETRILRPECDWDARLAILP